MTNMNKRQSGMSVHCHHDLLFEYCYDFQERVRYIKKEKPKNEIATRLKLFRLLTKKEIKMLPPEYILANEEWKEAYVKLKEANEKRKEANEKWKSQLVATHEKICGCKVWKQGKCFYNCDEE